ncbi:hypothetical protein JCM10207_002342 [Rhodosporidiobolus poonsookiae]
MALPLLQEHPPPPLPLLPLPPHSQSLLRSSAILPSLDSILVQLVHNSIDAHATRITATLDLDTFTLKCDDNGHGFDPHNLDHLASQHRRYSTSKLDHTQPTLERVSSYGFRGEALASIIDVAAFQILTRPLDDDTTYELVLRNGDVLKHGQASVGRAGHGTTVWARDIFWQFPVRRKPLLKPSAQHALSASLRSALAALSLAHPHIAFALVDTTASTSAGGEGKTLLQVARTGEGALGRWRQLWGRAGVEKVWEFDETDGGEGGGEGAVRARGFFSLSAAHSKAGQHVFVNARPLSPASSPLHKLLNALFASSSFARHASSHLSFPFSPAREPSTLPTTARKSPKKATERHPVFMLCLEMPSGWVDVTLEPEKRVVEFTDPKRIESFVTTLTKRFLTTHGFLSSPSAPARPPPPSASPAPPLASTSAPLVPVSAQTSKKRPFEAFRSGSVPPSRSSTALTPAAKPRAPVPTADPFALGAGQKDGADDRPARWVDPSTGQPWLVDPRTGNSWREGAGPSRVRRDEPGEEGAACERCGGEDAGAGERGGRAGRVERRWLKRRRGEDDGEGEKEEEVPSWLQGALEDWDNPVFPSLPTTSYSARRNPALPALPKDASSTSTAPNLLSAFSSSKRGLPSASSSAKHRASTSTAAPALTAPRVAALSSFFSSAAAPALRQPEATPLTPGLSHPPVRISRAALKGAEVVAQVDCKYLLLRVPSQGEGEGEEVQGGATLVLVDQHAASERVRVEGFWRTLCPPAGESVEERALANAGGEQPGLGVVVSADEARDVRRWEGEFARWGFRFAPAGEGEQKGEGGGDYTQLWLTAVPALVGARLAAEPGTAQELVRAYVAQLRGRGPPQSRGGAGGKEGGEGGEGWVARVRDAPEGLRELVESKACRGAVMFNDELTPAQCAALVARLAETRFPFQCAHGRPSLVPLVGLPAASAEERGKGVDWGKFA